MDHSAFDRLKLITWKKNNISLWCSMQFFHNPLNFKNSLIIEFLKYSVKVVKKYTDLTEILLKIRPIPTLPNWSPKSFESFLYLLTRFPSKSAFFSLAQWADTPKKVYFVNPKCPTKIDFIPRFSSLCSH